MKHMQKIIIALFFIGLILALRFSGITHYITLETIQKNSLYLHDYIQKNYIISILIFIGLYIIAVVSSLPLASLLTLSGGFFFGVIPGTVYANIGGTIGATISFLVTRYVLHDLIQKKYARYFEKINRAFARNGMWYLLSLRLIAFIPFSIANTVISLTKVSIADFIWTTSLGIIPASLVYAYAGRQLATIISITDVFSIPVLLAFIFLALLALIPTFLKRIGYGS